MYDSIFAKFHEGHRNVLGVLPTGGGKTVVFSAVIAALAGSACVAIAHRKELVSQMSLALAREGVRHRIIGSPALRRQCVAIHIAELGRDYHLAHSPIAAAGVDTLLNHDRNDPWLSQVRLWIQDEAHHVLKLNKWGEACSMFPNAFGLGVTACTTRADGKGLGSHADGVFDALIVGPPMRELINLGYLTDYRIFAPPSDINLIDVTITASGDYSPEKLRKARHASHITGNIVDHYMRLTPGKLGVTFDVDVEGATETAAAFRQKGISAEVVSAKTPDELRTSIIRRFRNREILQLVNVDLFGEGFDLPAIEVVSMGRPTESYNLFKQQFGRSLRILEGKSISTVIDHVGNVKRHGLPDAYREESLDRRERRSRGKNDAVPTRTCTAEGCYFVFEAYLRACPLCHTPVPIAGRSTPQHVDGDLVELDPAMLERMRGEVARIDGFPKIPGGVTPETAAAIHRNHRERQFMQSQLREQINLWAGWQTTKGLDIREAQKLFFFRYGVDVLSAMALNYASAQHLCSSIADDLNRSRIVDARTVVS